MRSHTAAVGYDEDMTIEELRPGLNYQFAREVTKEMTAAALGSGGVEVLATPVMIGLMEYASWQAVQEALPPGTSTVGTLVNVRHLAATPVGDVVKVRSELVEADGRRLVFQVEAWDSADRIGEGSHERFIVNPDRFLERLKERGKRAGG